ncbi:IS3 family transposase [Saprospira grandis]|uniref:IS3 family transposase n=1 Tax=Saprospira grandis TaxID=1008 RepID=UPI0008FB0AC1
MGFRRQTYYKRRLGHRPEVVDDEIANLLHEVVAEYPTWGFWKVFHYLRSQGLPFNHKKVYRIWRREELNLRLRPKS